MAATTSVITAFFSAVSSVFQWTLEKLRLRNTDEMRKNAAARTEGEIKDKAMKLVSRHDMEAVRKAVAE